MNILFLCRLFYPHIGGVEKHVFELTRSLMRKGHAVTIITEELKSSEKKRLPSNIEKELQQLTIYHIPVGQDDWFKKFRIWRWLWKNRKLFLKADVIHCHDVFFWYFPFAIFYPMKNVYTTFHGYETVFPPKRRAVFVRKISEYMSNKVMIVGEFIQKWYGTTAEAVTYGGVESFSISNSQFSNQQRKIKILFLGRIEEDNGVLVYNNVLNILSANNIPFKFLAIGEGSLRETFERWGKVMSTFTTSESIAQADIVFASSYLSILEAFIQKKPVFSVYQNPLKKDYLLMTPFKSWITASDNPNRLSRAIISYYKNPSSFYEKVERAYDWASQQTWEKLAKEYLVFWGETSNNRKYA